MHTLTPPFHFSIIACPLNQGSVSREILYRGSIPKERNFQFTSRLKLKTLVYLRKKQIDRDDPFSLWANHQSIALKWVEAKSMTEEKLGMGKNEVNEVLKVILDPSSYPLYIADIDGVSHTTLIVACLRKMMGWHIDSIIGEICRFEPEYEDYSLVPFITSYLSSTTNTNSNTNTQPNEPFNLPPPPYPSWLWPQQPQLTLTRTITKERSSTIPSQPPALLPFPNPLSARRHPTMKISFNNLPPVSSTPLSPSTLSGNNPSWATDIPPIRAPVSTASTRSKEKEDTNSDENQPVTPLIHSPSLRGANHGVNGLINGGMGDIESVLGEPKSPSRSIISQSWGGQGNASPENVQGRLELPSTFDTGLTNDDIPESDSPDEMMEEEEDEEYEEDEDDEDEDEEDDDVQPTSQYISALDLAGY